MALLMPYDTIADLIAVLDRDGGGFRSLRDQQIVTRARDLVDSIGRVPRITTVRCDTNNCPSRLELLGDWEPRDAAAVARGLGWGGNQAVHHCPACKEL